MSDNEDNEDISTILNNFNSLNGRYEQEEYTKKIIKYIENCKDINIFLKYLAKRHGEDPLQYRNYNSDRYDRYGKNEKEIIDALEKRLEKEMWGNVGSKFVKKPSKQKKFVKKPSKQKKSVKKPSKQKKSVKKPSKQKKSVKK